MTHTESKPTHTPGPWRVVRRNNKPVGLAYGYLRIETQANGASVAALQLPERDSDGEANARLIAASPDLLAACEELLKADEYAESVGVTLDDHMNRAERRRILTAAIAKARREGV